MFDIGGRGKPVALEIIFSQMHWGRTNRAY